MVKAGQGFCTGLCKTKKRHYDKKRQTRMTRTQQMGSEEEEDFSDVVFTWPLSEPHSSLTLDPRASEFMPQMDRDETVQNKPQMIGDCQGGSHTNCRKMWTLLNLRM